MNAIQGEIDQLISSDLSILTEITEIQGDVTVIQGDVTVIQGQISSLQTSQIRYSGVVYSNALMRPPTAINLIPAFPGKIIVPVSITIWMVYGGTNAFTNSPTMTIYYENCGSAFGHQTLDTNSDFWQGTVDGGHVTCISGRTNNPMTNIFGSRMNIKLDSGVTGNSANDNFLQIVTSYYIVDNGG